MEYLSMELLTDYVMPYVGGNEFRFIAGVNRSFYQAYTTTFPDRRRTIVNVSTVSHAKITGPELSEDIRQETLCAMAARHGQLDVLQYLREELSCPWDAETCAKAAKYQRWTLLKWAHEHGCPWDAHTYQWACKKGVFEILQSRS
jgi:hypothetical protein